ncbi:hypothetical protein OIU76_014602 [Salix suchowensis]|nr:hypothetical protein OIU76_014602 [Salix suchowensis]KAJ6309698.1 hypothetical protein OIU76_014602 [Salix suchowensis]
MAGGSAGRSLEQTPTWAVAVVCFVLVSVSIIIEFIIHRIAKWLTKKRKRALYEALEKMKSELVLLGFISLLLTVGQSPISSICISKKAGATWHPCNKKEEAKLNRSENTDYENRMRLLSISGSAGESFRRVLAAGASTDKCAAMAHLAPQSHTKFDFQKYINRSLEEDFKGCCGNKPTNMVLCRGFPTLQHSWLVFLSMASIYPIDYHSIGGD